jgi:hypothetical protein
MGKGPKKRSRSTEQRPSLFFIIALAIGLLMLAWLFVQNARNPQPLVEPLDYSAPPATTSQLLIP